jgi:hypothetical protein
MRSKPCVKRIDRRGEAASRVAAYVSSDDICGRRAPRPCGRKSRSLKGPRRLRKGQSPVEVGGRRQSAPASDFGRKVLEGHSIGAADDASNPPGFGDQQAGARFNDRLDRARRALGDIAFAFSGRRRETREESHIEYYSEKQNASIKCSSLQKLCKAAKVLTTASTPGAARPFTRRRMRRPAARQTRPELDRAAAFSYETRKVGRLIRAVIASPPKPFVWTRQPRIEHARLL